MKLRRHKPVAGARPVRYCGDCKHLLLSTWTMQDYITGETESDSVPMCRVEFGTYRFKTADEAACERWEQAERGRGRRRTRNR